jgi:hypothetical protein
MNVRTRYLATTILMAAVAVLYVSTAERPARPVAARAATSAPGPRPPLAVPPEAKQILTRQDLALTPSQRVRLEKLAADWSLESAALDTAVAVAQQDLERFMRATQDARRTSIDEFRRQSEDFQSRSIELRAARQRHASEALSVLDGQQRIQMAGRTVTVGGSQ